MLKRLFMICACAAAAISMSNAARAECGKVVMAEMNWASAELMANVDAFIMEHGYGCEIELVPGATSTTFPAMNEKGKPDVAGELWINAVREPLAKATKCDLCLDLPGGPACQRACPHDALVRLDLGNLGELSRWTAR